MEQVTGVKSQRLEYAKLFEPDHPFVFLYGRHS